MRNIYSIIILLIPFCFNAQSISGRIVDQNNRALEGASIYVVDTDLWAVSNARGFFQIESDETISSELVISFLGFEEKRIALELDAKETLDLGAISLVPQSRRLKNLTITALTLAKRSPFAFMSIDKEAIEEQNLGKDIPYLLRSTPSLITSSDSGTGIGYTSMWIRGTDATRINVTLNGVPFNDSESMGTFWVDLPDFASSVDQLQIQRGVGTSTHGAGAFGATLNLSTMDNEEEAFGSFSQSIGSYNTMKSTLQMGSGLIDGKWSFNARLSSINSDGYIDRASADLKSYYLQGSYTNKKTDIDLIHFSGKEITYQSWYGTPQSRIENDEQGMLIHAINNGLSEEQTRNLLESGRTYNFYTYENQVDDYKQDHYQLHVNTPLNQAVKLSAALHYTKGKGFFEEFRAQDELTNYKLSPVTIGDSTISQSDLVRRRWLDNDFYGGIFNIETSVQSGLYWLTGFAYNRYNGDHFGELIWSEFGSFDPPAQRYYFNIGDKGDFNIYTKLKLDLSEKLILFSDIQYRHVVYEIEGDDNDLRALGTDAEYNFFNPKFGLSFLANNRSRFYISYGIGNKEPNRSDFVDALNEVEPKSELLKDIELGYQYQKSNFDLALNGYYMIYENQLVLTGALNDVGSPIRENIESSYRLGLEISSSYLVGESIGLTGNLSLSRNKIENFSEIIYDYTNGLEIINNEYEQTDISFSPSIVGNASISYKPISGLKMELFSKYVGKRFLDNTSNDNRKIDPYWTSDFSISYSFQPAGLKKLDFSFIMYNVFSREYESNGYTFSYVFGDLITENFYYPQATRHFIANVGIRF